MIWQALRCHNLPTIRVFEDDKEKEEEELKE